MIASTNAFAGNSLCTPQSERAGIMESVGTPLITYSHRLAIASTNAFARNPLRINQCIQPNLSSSCTPQKGVILDLAGNDVTLSRCIRFTPILIWPYGLMIFICTWVANRSDHVCIVTCLHFHCMLNHMGLVSYCLFKQ